MDTQLDSPAIKSVADLCKQAFVPTVTQIGPKELGQYLISDGAGKPREIVTMLPELPPRAVATYSLEAFVLAVKHYGAEGTAIYYNQSGLTAVLDDQERRRSSISMALTKTPEWLQLEAFAKGAFYDQLSLIRLLRLNLAHACPSAPTVVAKVRKVRFQASEAIEGDVQRGRESLGKEITAELVQAAEVPETVTMQVRPFLELGQEKNGLADIDCLLDIDVHKKGFRLIPSPGAMQETLDAELALLEKDLVELLAAEPAKTFPVFYGTP